MPNEILFTGLSELLRASRDAGGATQTEVRAALAKSGEIVQADAVPRMAKYSTKSAAGFKVRVRQRGVSVEQSLLKTTGLRPDWGALQMRKALLPAVERKFPQVEAEFEKALDEIILIFER
jgi:hypothetical protein